MSQEIQTQNRVARNYEKRYSGTGFLYHSRIVTNMLDGIKFRDGRYSDKVLDVGCGTGFISQLFPNFDITGIDVSQGMLDLNPYKCQYGSAEDIPFEDNTFDYVLSRALLHHLDHPKKAVSEMMRVLKPGGKFVCLETNRSIINALPRLLFTYTPWFARSHKNFSYDELMGILTHKKLVINNIDFIGYIAYPLIGFPDFINLHLPLGIARGLMAFDDIIAKSIFKRLAFNIMIKGVKR